MYLYLAISLHLYYDVCALANYYCGKEVITERIVNRVNIVVNKYVKLEDTRTYH